jgi:putative alpha-1,2-mannosidase
MLKLRCLMLLGFAAQATFAQKAESLLKYVDPLVGTANSTTTSALKHGEGTEQTANTIPAVGVPFGMTQWTAQTHSSEQKCLPPYSYKDNVMSGFRGTHWLSGSCTQDYGSVTIMPVVGKLHTLLADYSAPFSHGDEVSRADYYRLILPKYHVTTELTGTARCGIMQFTLSQDDSLYLLVTPNSDKGKGFVKIDKAHNQIVGYNPAYRIYQGAGKPAGFSGYFVVQVQKQIEKGGVYCDGEVLTTDTISRRNNIGAYAGFKLKKGERLLVRIGISFTSLAEAKKNLQAEIPGWDFNAVRQQTAKKWESGLDKIQIGSKPKRKKDILHGYVPYHANATVI